MGSLVRSVFAILAGKSSRIFIAILFTPILVRIVSQEQYGIFASVMAGFSVISLLFKGGLFDASRKTIAEHVQNSDAVSTTISLSLCLGLGYGLLGTVLLIGGLGVGLIPERYGLYILVLSGALVSGNLLTVARGTFYGLHQEKWGEVLDVSQRVLYGVVGLGLAYIGYDLLGVFVGYTVSFTVLGLVGVLALSRLASFTLPSIRDVTERGRRIAAYGAMQLVGGLSAAILYKVDILLVEYFRGPTSTALYKSAIVPAEMIWFVPSVIQLAFLQHTASLWADDDLAGINRNLRTGIKYGVLSLTLFGAGLFALAEPFLQVYFGESYIGAATTLQILIFGTFFFGVSRVIIPVFQATGWIRVTELVALGALVLNVGLNVVLIPWLGIIGAGVGTAISYVAIFVGSVAIWRRSTIEIVPIRWSIRLVSVQGAFAAIFLMIASSVELSPLVSLVALPPLGLLLFVGFNASAGYLPRSELESIAASIWEG